MLIGPSIAARRVPLSGHSLYLVPSAPGSTTVHGEIHNAEISTTLAATTNPVLTTSLTIGREKDELFSLLAQLSVPQNPTGASSGLLDVLYENRPWVLATPRAPFLNEQGTFDFDLTMSVAPSLFGATENTLQFADATLHRCEPQTIPVVPAALRRMLQSLIEASPAFASRFLEELHAIKNAVELTTAPIHLCTTEGVHVIGALMRSEVVDRIKTLVNTTPHSSLNLKNEEVERLKQALTDRDANWVCLYASKKNAEPVPGPSSRVELQQLLEGSRAFVCTLQSEGSDWCLERAAPSITLPIDASDEQILREIGKLIVPSLISTHLNRGKRDVLSPISSLSASSQAEVLAILLGKVDQVIKPISPVIIPAGKVADSAPEHIAAGIPADFLPRPETKPGHTPYRSAVWRWTIAKVRIGEAMHTAVAEVRFHTKVSDFIDAKDPSFVVTALLKNTDKKAQNTPRGWCLLHTTDSPQLRSSVDTLNVPVIPDEHKRLWIPLHIKQSLHDYTNRAALLSQTALRSNLREVRERAQAELSKSMALANFLLPLIHFPCQPDLDSGTAGLWNSSLLRSRIEHSTLALLVAPPPPSIAQAIERIAAKSALHPTELGTVLIHREQNPSNKKISLRITIENNTERSTYVITSAGKLASSRAYRVEGGKLIDRGSASIALLNDVIRILDPQVAHGLPALIEPETINLQASAPSLENQLQTTLVRMADMRTSMLIGFKFNKLVAAEKGNFWHVYDRDPPLHHCGVSYNLGSNSRRDYRFELSACGSEITAIEMVFDGSKIISKKRLPIQPTIEFVRQLITAASQVPVP